MPSDRTIETLEKEMTLESNVERVCKSLRKLYIPHAVQVEWDYNAMYKRKLGDYLDWANLLLGESTVSVATDVVSLSTFIHPLFLRTYSRFLQAASRIRLIGSRKPFG